jgi:tetratricopeptide (TPR) repeat protein
MKFRILTLAMVLLWQTGFAQMGQITEQEIKLQELFIAANAEKLRGNYEKAIELFESFLEKDKENGAANYELARLYDLEEKNDLALKAAEKAAAQDGSNIWYQMFLAELYLEMNEDKKAAGVYESLVEKNPDEADFYFKWAYFLVRSNETEKAIKVYDELEKKIGVNEEVSRRKHSLYLGLGNYKKAEKELDVLIEKYPNNPEYRHLLANFFEQTGDKASAKNVYQQILKIDPEDAQAKIALADGNKKNGNKADYFAKLKDVFQNPGVHIDVKITEIFPLVTQVADNGNKEMAADVLELAYILEEVHPNDAKSYSIIGDLLYYSNDKEKALEYYKKTLERDESVYLVWEQMLYVLADLRDYDKLVKESDNALDLYPNQGTLFYLNGLGYSGLKKHKDAVSSLQQALIMASKNPRLKFQTHNLLGREYGALQQYERADKNFEEALKLNPQDPIVLNSYSHSLAQRDGGDLEKAKEMSATANDLAPNQPRFQDTYGWVFYQLKDYKNAKKWLVKAVEGSAEKDATILEHYGDTLSQLGEDDAAVSAWQKALALEASAELEKKIAERKVK